jgi:hypothetical protein
LTWYGMCVTATLFDIANLASQHGESINLRTTLGFHFSKHYLCFQNFFLKLSALLEEHEWFRSDTLYGVTVVGG